MLSMPGRRARRDGVTATRSAVVIAPVRPLQGIGAGTRRLLHQGNGPPPALSFSRRPPAPRDRSVGNTGRGADRGDAGGNASAMGSRIRIGSWPVYRQLTGTD